MSMWQAKECKRGAEIIFRSFSFMPKTVHDYDMEANQKKVMGKLWRLTQGTENLIPCSCQVKRNETKGRTMTLDQMINHGITIEGGVEIRVWDSEIDDALVLFKDDAYELDYYASYMYENVQYMFAYNDGYRSVLCFELAS